MVSGCSDPSTRFVGLKRSLVERFGLLVLTLAMVDGSQVIDSAQGVGVPWPKHPLLGLKRTLVERLASSYFPWCQYRIARLLRLPKVWECSGPSTALGRSSALVEWFCFLVLPLVPVEFCQVVDGLQGVGVLRPQHLFTDRQFTFPEWFRLPVLAPLIEVIPYLIEQASHL